MKRLARLNINISVLLLGAAYSISVLQAHGQPLSPDNNKNLALVGAKIYPSPLEKPIDKGVVLIRNGKIVAVGEEGKIKIPLNTVSIDCAGLTLMAGFWNSHVHFIESKWETAASMPSSQLARQLQDMLTSYGFTTVFDTGSSWEITKTIGQRIESGSVTGPKIFSTGPILFSKGGTPPANLLKSYGFIMQKMPELENAQQATAIVRQELKSGVDAIKIYAQAWWDPNLKMPLDVVKAVTAEAHRQGKLVFVHPSGSYGLEAAIESGADILAHTTPSTGPWDTALLTRMKQAHLSLIPTLMLWRIELEKGGAPPDAVREFQNTGVGQLQAYFHAGGQILFGTDLGYIQEYNPTEEYQLMKKAGMRFQDILASLTTTPAERFGRSGRAGRIAPGMDADIVVLTGDPMTNIEALSSIKYTLRKGRVIYQSK
jgi:imidazolonepropionase-like amidohydrolase